MRMPICSCLGSGRLFLLVIGVCLPLPPAARASSFLRPPEPAVTATTLEKIRALGPGSDRRVWVFFTDKAIPDGGAYEKAVRTFAADLDPHAAARREKALGSAQADLHDLPVPARYIRALETRGATILRTSRWLNAASVRAPLSSLHEIARLPFVSHLSLVRAGRSAPVVRSAPMAGGTRGRGGLTPDGPGTQEAFDYGPSFGQLDEILVTDLHALGYSGAGVIIAMLDTGYERTHPAFARVLAEGRLLAQWDFINNDGETQNEPGDPGDQQVHGTATWSILGGFDEGELIGAAWGASFLLAKTEDVSGETPVEEDNWVAAMEWADAYGADILSSSLSYTDWYTYPDMDGDTAVTTVAADIAASRGILVSSAAGNWGTQDWYYIGAPADADSILAVGGTLPSGERWDESSHGPTYDGRIKPEVCARAEGTYSAWPEDHGGPYIFAGGTSTACPLVAGAAALLLEAHTSWSAMEVREALMLTADQADAPDNDRGWGRINALAAWGGPAAAPAGEIVGVPLRVWPNPSPGPGLYLSFSGQAVEIYTVAGELVRRLAASAGGTPVAGTPTQTARSSVRWNGLDSEGRAVAPGTYFVRVAGSRPTSALKLTLLP